jgi:hypothetical protein
MFPRVDRVLNPLVSEGYYCLQVDRDSVVGIPVGARIFALVEIGPGAQLDSCKMGTVSLSSLEKSDQEMSLTIHPN